MNARADRLNPAIPPHSLEAEQSVLGALLLNNAVWDQVADLIHEADFYRDEHRRIYRHIGALIEAGKPADLVTVSEALGEDLERAGGIAYLGGLAQGAGVPANVRRHAEIVADRAQKRAVIVLCSDLLGSAYGPSAASAVDMLDEATAKLLALSQRNGRATATPFRGLLSQVMESIDERYHRDGGSITGVPTGFVDLDEKTAGLQPGNLIIVAGRPSMGKTALAMNIVEHVAVELGQPVLVFSLEMSDKELTQRLIGSAAKIDQHSLRTGRLGDHDWQRLSETMGRLHEAPIIIEETFDLAPATIRAKARRIHHDHGRLGLIVVDYLQLMESHAERRVDQIAEISRGLKRLAKELDVPVVALSQLNRGAEQRPNKRPMMSDLRDSGAIEQDADLILFLYRDEEYDKATLNPGVAEVNIGKQRNGSTGTVYLTFLKEFTRFENFAGQINTPERRPRSKAFEPAPHRADIYD